MFPSNRLVCMVERESLSPTPMQGYLLSHEAGMWSVLSTCIPVQTNNPYGRCQLSGTWEADDVSQLLFTCTYFSNLRDPLWASV